jgi:hypothetical protein
MLRRVELVIDLLPNTLVILLSIKLLKVLKSMPSDYLMSRAPAATEPSSRPVLPPQFFKFQLFEILRVGSVDFIYKSAPAGFEPARASAERYYRPLS